MNMKQVIWKRAHRATRSLAICACCVMAVACQAGKTENEKKAETAVTQESLASEGIERGIAQAVKERFGEDKEFKVKEMTMRNSQGGLVIMVKYETEDSIQGNCVVAASKVNFEARGSMAFSVEEKNSGSGYMLFWCQPEAGCPYEGRLEWRDSVLVSPCKSCVMHVSSL